MVYDDNVKSTFRYCKYHPDIASAFAVIIQQFLWIPLGGMFIAIVTPSNFEPITRARVHSARFFSQKRDLLHKYSHIIDKVEFSTPSLEDIKFTQATICKYNKGFMNVYNTQYSMLALP